MKTVLVFTKKKFVKDRGRAIYKQNKRWVDKLNGRTIEEINKMGYIIFSDYCKTIKTGGNK